MTIRIFPSRLPGEPLEKHEHGTLTLHDWMLKNVKDYAEATKHPIAVELNGKPLPPNEWPLCLLKPESDIKMFPVPYGTGLEIAAWAAIAVAVASAAYSIYMMSTMDKGGGYSSTNGLGLDLNPAKANTAKLGDAIRELFGRYRIYPDYVVQPVTRFDPNDPTRMIVEMLVCLGVGNIAFTNGDIRVGSSPATSLGTKFSCNVFSPGADVSGDHRSENWFNSTEVGGTSSGSGLDLAQTSPDSSDINADSMTVSGPLVSFSGLIDDNPPSGGGIGTLPETNTLPDSWVPGAIVTLNAPANYLVSTSSGYSVIASDTLSELNPYSGMPVTLAINGADYDLVIAAYTPHQNAVPGVGGTAASLRGNAVPTTYDFSVSGETFDLH